MGRQTKTVNVLSLTSFLLALEVLDSLKKKQKKKHLFLAEIASNCAIYGVKLLKTKEKEHFVDLSNLLGHNS